eukprot:TRINITY_DN4590_c0_g1_i2.p1 TRINITY_DN4590_c0_g1~~TRINITY_DN4590_c0_g1_i2.p1  ORF type:complete len:384 (-),score=70.19 TRINITY_DN4590_c0_g1_i2:66-1217(-)
MVVKLIVVLLTLHICSFCILVSVRPSFVSNGSTSRKNTGSLQIDASFNGVNARTGRSNNAFASLCMMGSVNVSSVIVAEAVDLSRVDGDPSIPQLVIERVEADSTVANTVFCDDRLSGESLSISDRFILNITATASVMVGTIGNSVVDDVLVNVTKSGPIDAQSVSVPNTVSVTQATVTQSLQAQTLGGYYNTLYANTTRVGYIQSLYITVNVADGGCYHSRVPLFYFQGLFRVVIPFQFAVTTQPLAGTSNEFLVNSWQNQDLVSNTAPMMSVRVQIQSPYIMTTATRGFYLLGYSVRCDLTQQPYSVWLYIADNNPSTARYKNIRRQGFFVCANGVRFGGNTVMTYLQDSVVALGMNISRFDGMDDSGGKGDHILWGYNFA